MADAIGEVIESLRQSIAGSLNTPEDPKHDHTHKVWNAVIDRRLAAIVQCTSARDVAATLGLGQ
jgi:hypothetical protein